MGSSINTSSEVHKANTFHKANTCRLAPDSITTRSRPRTSSARTAIKLARSFPTCGHTRVWSRNVFRCGSTTVWTISLHYLSTHKCGPTHTAGSVTAAFAAFRRPGRGPTRSSTHNSHTHTRWASSGSSCSSCCSLCRVVASPSHAGAILSTWRARSSGCPKSRA